MSKLSEDGQRIAKELAAKHGFSVEAVETLIAAVAAGHGHAAQFSHPELGGMGQWSQGGMIMIGDMFNNGLKDRVAGLCTEIAALVAASPAPMRASQSQSQSSGGLTNLFAAGPASGQWWPADLGHPSSTGAQNNVRYAFFPSAKRLAIEEHGALTVYDTGDHAIGGFSQAQGSGHSLHFTSQHGIVRIGDLKVMSGKAAQAETKAAAAPVSTATSAIVTGDAQTNGGDALEMLERVHELHRKGILSDDEYAAKKRELLSRI